MCWRPRAAALAMLILAAGCGHRSDRADDPQRVTPSLERPTDLSEWVLDGTGVWRIDGGTFVLETAGVPGGSIRRPAALAILRTAPFERATISADIRSTAPRDIRQRDLVLIVGYQGPSRFYYVHLAGLTDAVHNGVFLVADADRRRIDAGTAPPRLVDREWHSVRLEWDGGAGTFAVWVDGSPEPVLEARDATLTRGRVGFGSFDDTGEFRDIRVLGWR